MQYNNPIDEHCKFEDCNELINKPYSKDYCVFHCDVKDKGIQEQDFNNKIRERINKNQFNFRGFIFPWSLDFARIEFKYILGDVNFENTVFCASVNFQSCIFGNINGKKGSTYFSKCKFKDDVIFNQAQFYGDSALFEGSVFEKVADFQRTFFSCEGISFDNAKFIGDVLFISADVKSIVLGFSKAQFNGERISFDYSQLQCKSVNFNECIFKCDFVSFKSIQIVSEIINFDISAFAKQPIFLKSSFDCSTISFNHTIFHSGINIEDTDFKYSDVAFGGTTFDGPSILKTSKFFNRLSFINVDIHSKLSIQSLTLSAQAHFHFRNPDIILIDEDSNRSINESPLLFSHTNFNPSITFFQDIQIPLQPDNDQLPLFLFRFCNLKDVYFHNCQLSFFSFYKSTFDEARFISSNWDLPNDQDGSRAKKITLAEERIFNNLSHRQSDVLREHTEKYQIKGLSRTELVQMYRQLKYAADRTRDFQNAGRFYYSEFEARRLALKESNSCTSKIKSFFPYWIYKMVAGYGERPLWSFGWLVVFLILFSVIHLFSGLNFNVSSTINYDLCYPQNMNLSIAKLGHDFSISLLYSFYRIIPLNIMPKDAISISHVGLDGLLWSILNTMVMASLAAFIFTGLKRQFKRFQ